MVKVWTENNINNKKKTYTQQRLWPSSWSWALIGL